MEIERVVRSMEAGCRWGCVDRGRRGEVFPGEMRASRVRPVWFWMRVRASEIVPNGMPVPEKR